MLIEIPDTEGQTILAGLRSHDNAVVSRIADLLQKEVDMLNRFPFAVYRDGTHLGDYASLKWIIEKEFDLDQADADERRRYKIYERGMLLDIAQIMQKELTER